MSEEKRIQEYQNDEITVRFNPNICAHSAICIKKLPGVFNLKGKPWVNLSGATKQEIVSLIQKCPSGALTYELKGNANPEPMIAANVIAVMANGPLRLSGQVRIVDDSGKVLFEGDRCTLCRCGASDKKPFCDGSHFRVGFKG